MMLDLGSVPNKRGGSSRLCGAKWRQTHQMSVDTILGVGVRRVHSGGSRFLNIDRWTGRLLLGTLCTWVKENPGVEITEEVVRGWVETINSDKGPLKPRIVIAETPDKITKGTAMALVGGAYHEAWHTKYSERGDLCASVVWREIAKRKDAADWSQMAHALLSWANTIEDTRIERRGIEDYPGTYANMAALSDLIQDQEDILSAESDPELREKIKNSILEMVFRDVSLGYDTPMGQEVMGAYQRINPTIWEMVNTGVMRPFVEAAQNMSADDTMGCIWMAMDVVAMLQDLAGDGIKGDHNDHKEEQEDQEDQKLDGAAQAGGVGSGGNTSNEGIPCGVSGGVSGGAQDVIAACQGALDAHGEKAHGAKIKIMISQESAIGQAILREIRRELMQEGEKIWHPFSTDEDVLVVPKAEHKDYVRKVLAKVRPVTSFLRARLRNKFLEARETQIFHGVRKGGGLSERRLADSWADIITGNDPQRPDYLVESRPDVSLCVGVVVDMSGSMHSIKEKVDEALVSLVEPLDFLGCPTMVAGFQDCWGNNMSARSDMEGEGEFHRSGAVRIVMMKDWNEKFRDCMGRFRCGAGGGTPMSDGIQFAMQILSERKERHRIIFVLTDGDADFSHIGVIHRQVRQARDAGVRIIGIGLEGEDSVRRQFRESIVIDNIKNLGPELLRTISNIVFPSVGKKISLDGRMSPKLIAS